MLSTQETIVGGRRPFNVSKALSNVNNQRAKTEKNGRFIDDSYENTQAGIARDEELKSTEQQRWHDHLDQKNGLLKGTTSTFDKINKGLVKVADTAMDLPIPGVNTFVKTMYKNFAPEGSKFHTEGSFADKAANAGVDAVKSLVGLGKRGRRHISVRVRGGMDDGLDRNIRNRPPSPEPDGRKMQEVMTLVQHAYRPVKHPLFQNDVSALKRRAENAEFELRTATLARTPFPGTNLPPERIQELDRDLNRARVQNDNAQLAYRRDKQSRVDMHGLETASVENYGRSPRPYEDQDNRISRLARQVDTGPAPRHEGPRTVESTQAHRARLDAHIKQHSDVVKAVLESAFNSREHHVLGLLKRRSLIMVAPDDGEPERPPPSPSPPESEYDMDLEGTGGTDNANTTGGMDDALPRQPPQPGPRNENERNELQRQAMTVIQHNLRPVDRTGWQDFNRIRERIVAAYDAFMTASDELRQATGTPDEARALVRYNAALNRSNEANETLRQAKQHRADLAGLESASVSHYGRSARPINAGTNMVVRRVNEYDHGPEPELWNDDPNSIEAHENAMNAYDDSKRNAHRQIIESTMESQAYKTLDSVGRRALAEVAPARYVVNPTPLFPRPLPQQPQINLPPGNWILPLFPQPPNADMEEGSGGLSKQHKFTFKQKGTGETWGEYIKRKKENQKAVHT